MLLTIPFTIHFIAIKWYNFDQWPKRFAGLTPSSFEDRIFEFFLVFFKKNWPIPASFCLFLSFFMSIPTQMKKSLDGVLGTRTRGRRMVGADETTELWRPSLFFSLGRKFISTLFSLPTRLNDVKIGTRQVSETKKYVLYFFSVFFSSAKFASSLPL